MTWIAFQNPFEAGELTQLEPMTAEVLALVVKLSPFSIFFINEISRSTSDPNWNKQSWHCQGKGPWRAIDASLVQDHFRWTKAQALKVKEHVDAFFQYDPERPEMSCIVIHEPFHMHIQTHPRTRRKR